MQIENNDAERNASRGLELVSCPTARTRQLAELSEEMIMEILLRLPARTLLSLKSVCTSWRNLISAPDFTRNHLCRSFLRDPSLTPPRIAFYDHWPDRFYRIGVLSVQSMIDNPSEPTKVDYFRRQRYYRMVGSCHGLLCFFDEHDYQNTHAIMWNPCTGFTFESPQISGKARLCGFGYHHLSDSYKLFVNIWKEVPYGLEFSTRIYTFGPTSLWRSIDDIPFSLFGVPKYGPFVADNKEGIFFSSNTTCTINWSLRHHHVVLYFDLGKETYGSFPLPGKDSDDDPWKRFIHLCVLRNCLSICYEHTKTQHWIVWQMKEYEDTQSWTKLAIIPFHPHLGYATRINSPLQPLYILESDVLLAISPSFKIVLCNLIHGSVDFPMMIGSSSDGMEKYPYLSQSIDYRVVYIYHESLVSPNGLQSNSSKMHFIKPKPKPIIS